MVLCEKISQTYYPYIYKLFQSILADPDEFLEREHLLLEWPHQKKKPVSKTSTSNFYLKFGNLLESPFFEIYSVFDIYRLLTTSFFSSCEV